MNLISHTTTTEPWNLLSRLHRDLERLMQPIAPFYGNGSSVPVADWAPAVDIREEPGQFVLHTDLPGMKAGDVEVTLEKGVLTLRGKREIAARDEKNGFRVVERAAGSFYRSFTLPDTVDAKGVKAKFHDGVLTVTVPKQPQATPRRIAIEAD